MTDEGWREARGEEARESNGAGRGTEVRAREGEEGEGEGEEGEREGEEGGREGEEAKQETDRGRQTGANLTSEETRGEVIWEKMQRLCGRKGRGARRREEERWKKHK